MTDPIKAKIIELCPDVVLEAPLKVGSRVVLSEEGKSRERNSRKNKTWGTIISCEESDYYKISWDGFKSVQFYPDVCIVSSVLDELPITLSVVLRAIEKYSFPAHNRNQVRAMNAWNLEHDNYDQQSEECKQFIGSLLLSTLEGK